MAPYIRRKDGAPALWRDLPGLTPYDEVLAAMERARGRVEAGGREEVWLLESPAGYSRGSSSVEEDGPPLDPDQPPVEGVGRRAHAGSWWYHGPGVLGFVLLLDLRARRRSVSVLIEATHDWLRGALALLGASTAPLDLAREGLWVGGVKVATVAMRVTRWTTSYGGAVVVDPEPGRFEAMAACGVAKGSVGSLAGLGLAATRAGVAAALRVSFHEVFGPTSDAPGELPK